MAMATAELSTLRPVEGGYYRWVREIFGEYWGFQAGTWAIIASLLDNALYPALFGKSLQHWFPDMPWWQQNLAAVGFILVLTFLNYRGIGIVGTTSVVLSLFLMAPLVWVVVAGLMHARFNPLVPFRAAGVNGLDGFGSGLARPEQPIYAGELTMGYSVAVVGATGNVGREMLGILAERSFPADEIVIAGALEPRTRLVDELASRARRRFAVPVSDAREPLPRAA